jgi:hypothetical protein
MNALFRMALLCLVLVIGAILAMIVLTRTF